MQLIFTPIKVRNKKGDFNRPVSIRRQDIPLEGRFEQSVNGNCSGVIAAGNFLQLTTEAFVPVPLRDQPWFSTHLHFLSLSVRACSDVHILLSSSATAAADTRRGYEIVIGYDENVMSAIRRSRGGDAETSVLLRHLVDCAAYRAFWITWSGGVIRVGAGRLYHGEFMSYRDDAPRAVNAFSVATAADVHGVWRIPVRDGE